MPEYFVLAVAISVLAGMLLVLFFGRSNLAKALAVFLMAYPLGIWMLLHTYTLYQQGLAPKVSRHNTAAVLASDPTYGTAAIVFHVALGLFIIGAGTYFGVRRFREWRNAA